MTNYIDGAEGVLIRLESDVREIVIKNAQSSARLRAPFARTRSTSSRASRFMADSLLSDRDTSGPKY